MKKIKYLLFAAVLAFTGCADDGDPGPKGDKGDAGEQGAEGPQGDQGPQGDPGTANVLYSEWMDFDWNVVDESEFKQMEVDVPAFTEDFLNEGGILFVFLKASSAEVLATTAQLPISNSSESMAPQTLILTEPTLPFTIQNGFVINLSSQDGNPVNDYQDAVDVNYDFRYILIPGGAPISSAGRFAQAVDFSDYEAVKTYYNIPD